MEFGSFQLTEFGLFDSYVKFPKAMITEPRTVQEYEIELYVEDQSGISYVDGIEIPLKKGVLLCTKPGMVRYSKLPFKCLYVHIITKDPYLCGLLDRLQSYSVLQDFSSLSFLFRRLLSFDAETFPEEKLLLSSNVAELLYRIVQEVGSENKEINHAHKLSLQFVAQYIRNNLKETLSLKSLAEMANLSSSYFHKLFTNQFNCTPSEFVVNCRISAAKSMLMEGELSMEEIADVCGFSCHSYFNHCFKQRTGQTPLQYRRESLSKLQP